MRNYQGRALELLAPVGTYADFEAIITSKCDAVYLGGKSFNMRNHKKNHNFSDEELAEAVKRAHELGKKVYVTLNSMLSDEEMQLLPKFLKVLEGVGPDGLIVADMGVVKRCRELGVTLDLHLSVMANVHNAAMVELAQSLGVVRVVLSREMPLWAVSELVKAYPDMEYEYFVHGDMCSVHGAQCLLSGSLLGKSSNRGACMKPCRWSFEEGGHALAVKDMALYRHLPELIDSGVNSFKIEGRMRDALYLVDVIDAYGEAMDRYLVNPGGYLVDQSVAKVLWDNRVRDFSTAYSFKIPGAGYIAADGEREPRIFSLPVGEPSLQQEAAKELKVLLEGGSSKERPLLSVSVNSYEACLAAAEAGADCIYVNGETFRPEAPFDLERLKEVTPLAQFYYRLPRMTSDRQLRELEPLVATLPKLGFKGLVVSNSGQLHRFKDQGLELIGDYGLNIYNRYSAAFYEELGLSRVMLSLEATAPVVKEILQQGGDWEILVHGAPTLMYLDHCLLAARHGLTAQDWCHDFCMEAGSGLTDEKGNRRRLYGDRFCKNHLLPEKDLCLLPVVSELCRLGARALFLELRHERADAVGQLVSLYRTALDTELSFGEAWRMTLELEKNQTSGLSLLGFGRK